jgi:hypothetical protein
MHAKKVQIQQKTKNVLSFTALLHIVKTLKAKTPTRFSITGQPPPTPQSL